MQQQPEALYSRIIIYCSWLLAAQVIPLSDPFQIGQGVFLKVQ